MTVTDATGFDDPYLPLAFSMHSTPGAYAVLAGAGVSFGVVPTAWEIVVELAKRACRIRGDAARAETIDKNNVGRWFYEAFGKRLTYGDLLAELAPAPYERGAVLREFFEPASTSEDEITMLAAPTDAHRAVAKLVANGTVRVIVTMNFDHLFEAALREVGVEPVVVATDSAARGLAPLHTLKCCVVHLHGSYRDPSSMLNTDDELAEYGGGMQELLRTIVSSHGLLIAGWSAEWDRALRDTLRRDYRPFYTSVWIDPFPLNDDAVDLANALGASTFRATADEAFSRLSDAVGTIKTSNARHFLTPDVVANRLKKELGGHAPAISAHDTFMAEAGLVDELAPLNLTDFAGVPQTEFDSIVRELDAGCAVLVAAIATLARWGSADTDRWWLPLIEQWAHVERESGSLRLIELRTLAATRFLYAAALGAVAAGRYDTLMRVFTVAANDRDNRSILDLTDWAERHSSVTPAVAQELEQGFLVVVRRALGVTATRFDTIRQEFEILRITAQIMSAKSFRTFQTRAVEPINAELLARRTDEGTSAHRTAIAERDAALDPLAAMATSSRPHIQMIDTMERSSPDGRDRWISPVAQRLIERPDGALVDALRTLMGSGSQADRSRGVTVALRATTHFLDQKADRLAYSELYNAGTRNGVLGGVLPRDVWLDIRD